MRAHGGERERPRRLPRHIDKVAAVAELHPLRCGPPPHQATIDPAVGPEDPEFLMSNSSSGLAPMPAASFAPQWHLQFQGHAAQEPRAGPAAEAH